MSIGMRKGNYKLKKKQHRYRLIVIPRANVKFFYLTNIFLFLPILTNKYTKSQEGVSSQERIRPFLVLLRRHLSFRGGRSPPFILNLKKFQNGGKDMEGNRPKRRKDKYNPYTICEKDGQYYVSFKDGQGILHRLEISKVLYDTFDSFELSDLVYLNVVDRHIEQSEVWEATLKGRTQTEESSA